MLNYHAFKQFLDDKECHYDEAELKESYRITLFNKINNEIPVEMQIYFKKEHQGIISIYMWDFVKVREEKLQDYYKLLNDINHDYRYIKLYIDKDNSLSSSYNYSCGEDDLNCDAFFDIICVQFGILKEVMPDIMKLRWS